MTLPPLVLDDLSWETLVDTARRRIPAASAGVWTLHAPVDPGITLLELFAYLLEQRLYHLDQVPDELVLAILDLLGVEPPRPARPAATVLRVAVERELARPTSVAIASGTEFSRDPLRQVIFTLQQAVTVLPFAPEPPRLTAGGRDRSADLLAERGVPLLPSDGTPAEFGLEFPLLADYRPPTAATALSLLLDLAGPVAGPPSWHPDAVGDVPPPAELDWLWYDPAAPESQWPVDGIIDGTAGLRRSGVVTLPLPAAWCADGATVRAYGLRVATHASTFAAPPMLRQAVPNVAEAGHSAGRTAGDLSAQSARWHRLPGQEIVLEDARGTLLDATVTITRGGEAQTWKPVPGRAFSAPGDRVFTIDRTAGVLRFGDGLTGGIPAPDAGAGAVAASYTVGGGVAGNGGRSSQWVAVEQPLPDAVITAANVVVADGGRDPESVDEARTRATGSLAEFHRAVTEADSAELALRTPGVAVARCHVAVGAHPAYPCSVVPGAVTVRVLPRVAAREDGPAEVYPDPGMLTAVHAGLAEARLLGTELFVRGPRYRTVRLSVDLRGRPADLAAVRATLRLALRRHLDPLIGGDAGDGWPFGEALRPTALIRVAQRALGDTAEVTAVGIGVDGDDPAADCFDTELRPGELPALHDITLRVLPASAGRGLS